MTTILVCGGRTFHDAHLLNNTLDRLDRELSIASVITGGCTGADQLANIWAQEKGKVQIIVPAKWHLYNNAAGPIRNSEMLAMKPDLVVAFQGGRGTQDTITKAKALGLNVLEVT